MKKAFYILTALLAFACGVFVFYVRPLLIPFSLSELRQNSAHYKSHKFKVRGKFTVWKADQSNYFLDLKDWEGACSVEPNCGYSLKISEALKAENINLLKQIAEKNHTIGKTDFRRIEYFADVEITGILIEEVITENFPGTIYDAIKVEKIEQLSPIKFVLLD